MLLTPTFLVTVPVHKANLWTIVGAFVYNHLVADVPIVASTVETVMSREHI